MVTPDIVAAAAAGVVGLGAITSLFWWAETQRGRVVRGESCICAPHRDIALTPMRTGRGFTSATAIDTSAVEQQRHELALAIERERHYSELQRHYSRQAPQPQPLRQLPAPQRRRMPRLPAPSTVEMPTETVTADGYRWVALEREVNA